MIYRIGFRLGWLEMLLILFMVFFSGVVAISTIEDKFVITGLLLLGAGIILMKKRVKIPVTKQSDK